VSDDTELNGMEPTSPEEVPAAPEPAPAPAPAASSGDFLSTTAGKVVLIVGAVLVLLVVAAIVGWFVLGPASLGGTGTPAVPVTVVPSSGTPTTPATPASSTVTTLPVADITSRDVFTPRNPFKVIEPEVIATSTASTSDTSHDETSTLDPDVVTVIDIKTVSGVRKAVIAFGGVTYTVGPGDSFGGHDDWTVVTVHTTSVDVLMDGVTVNLTEQHTSK
jgi:hypothetical protein